MGYFDVPIDFGTLVLPTLLTVVGSAYATHVVARHREEIDAGGTPGDIAYRVIRHLGTPVLVTALTTVLGFASLIVYRIEAIQHLGVFSVFGISALFVLALTFVPAVLTLLRVPQTGTGREPESAWLTGGLERLGRFDMRHRKTVIAASAIVLVFFTWGIRYMRVDTNYARYFSEDSPVREASRVIADHLGGSVAFLVAVDGPEPDSITRLDTLRRIAALEDFIDRLPGIDHTTSVVDYVKTLHRAFHDDDPAYFGLPDTDAGVQQYLLLLDPETIEDVVNADSSRATIVVRSRLVGSTALREAITSIRRFAADVFPEGYPVHTTGNVVLLNRTADDLSRGQVQSFVIALAVVFAILSLVFLSVRFGLVAMVPNLIPIVIFFGLLGWLNIPLSISTAVIASISLGIGVDEAVHLLAEFNHHVRKAADQEEAVLGALRSVGPPIVYATTALVLGFLVPAWSNFAPVRQFGLLSAVTVATSLLADLLLLPALLATARFVTLWDVLTVKLGRAPHETIPLFNGLRASQARIAALMGRLRTVGPAERIVARGEPGDEMYVLIRGSAQVLAGADGQEIALRTVTRGDVVGEMGLLRGQPRTAEVRALEETDLLVVNERFLQVLRRRYPRIATTVFFNLIRIVSDRLQETTEQLVARRTAAADASGKDAARRAGAGP
jgi:predicted RND superfamily exporter protein/CRP-like cAMP-binding protein